MKGKPGRHVPAFVLLIVAKQPAYGLQILNQLKEDMPYCRLDSAAVYRALSQLESSGAIQVYDQNNEVDISSDSGISKKFYAITESGKVELEDFYHDIKERQANLAFFLNAYSQIGEMKHDK